MLKRKVPIEDVLKKLRGYLVNYNDDEEATTDKHGIWSLKKILVLHDYVKPYLQIIRNNGFKNVHYIDPFAGSGFLKIRGKIMPGTPLVPLLTTRELVLENKTWYFDSVYYSDLNQKFLTDLESRVNALIDNLPTKYQIEKNSFRTVAITKFKGVPPLPQKEKDDAYLVVLDPFGFTVEWALLENILKSGPVDVILTFPSELANWTKTMSNNMESLEKLYGSKDFLDLESSQEFVEEYCNKIKSIPMNRPKFTEAITVDAGKQTYHLICISRSKGALSVFSSMQKKFDDISTEKLEGMFNAAVGEGITRFLGS